MSRDRLGTIVEARSAGAAGLLQQQYVATACRHVWLTAINAIVSGEGWVCLARLQEPVHRQQIM